MNLLLIVIFLIFIVVFLIFLLIFLSLYFAFRPQDNLFNDYDKQTQKLLKKYGNCEIRQVYIYKNTLGPFLTWLLNLITFYHYRTLSQREEFVAQHVAMVVKLKNKYLKIEKNPTFQIVENFSVACVESKPIRVKMTLQELLETTKERIGTEKFFNWHFFKNNCQSFIKELMFTLQKDFPIDEKLSAFLFSQDFSNYMINGASTLSNLIEKYLFKYY